MKRFLSLLACILITSAACTKAHSTKSEDTPNENISVRENVIYKLFPTQNMWTFIKLNTRNGKMWQVQYSVKGEEYRFETDLNRMPLISEKEESNGRFMLYPTQNTYNFILLDQLDGRTWQVQWSMEAENRGIMPIE